MGETDINHQTIEVKTRSNISYILVIGGLAMLAYIVFRWGDKTEILTLIIGLIGGTILGMPLGVYYSANTSKKGDQPTILQTGDNPVAAPVNNGYQPVNDVTTTPPDGGSGVPDAKV